jgi:pyruvate/2-oxoglutarate dehydrogenase complex dihydrolipoamide acyltransferase (E2) component
VKRLKISTYSTFYLTFDPFSPPFSFSIPFYYSETTIINILVQEGEEVETGQTLIVLEAMKMEHPLKATRNGTVESVLTSIGEQVKGKQLLIKLADLLDS